MKQDPLIFISAADISSESHAANLVEAVRRLRPAARFVGVGGEKLASKGVELIAEVMGQSAMTYAAFIKIGYFVRIIERVGRIMRQRNFDVAVFLDSPALHFPMARKAKNQRIPSLYYIAPQLWAWGRHRMRKLRWLLDRVACILPFEEQWFRSYGIDATYVGYPLFDDFQTWRHSKRTDLKKGSPTIALLPGSRAHEVKALTPAMIIVARRVRERWPDASFVVPAANERIYATVTDLLAAEDRQYFHVERGIIHQAIEASDFCVVASGTATLEIAAYGRPMVAMYHVNPVIWKLIGWWLVPQRPMCLVNILAGRIIVPEFMPWYGSPEPVVQKVLELLADKQALAEMSRQLLKVAEPLKRGGTADRTAQMLLELADNADRRRKER